MKRALLILIAAACAAHAQTTSITVMAETNRAIRTNFTIGNAQVTGLSGLLDQKLGLTGNGSGVTNLNPANLSGPVAINRGGTGATNASDARANLGLGSAATNPASAFQPAGDGATLTNLAASNIVGTVALASNVTGTVTLTNGGTGATNAASALAALLPSYASNASKVLAVNTNENGVQWVTSGGGGGGLPETPLAISNGGSGASDVVGVLSNFTLVRGSRVTLGTAVTNANDDSVAIGASAVARLGTEGIAIGKSAVVWSNKGIAIGADSTVTPNNGTIGDGVAVGWDAYAERGVAIGNKAQSTSTGSTTNFFGIAIGNNAVAYEDGISIGSDAVSDHNAISIGNLSYIGSRGAIAIGFAAEATATNAIQFGTGTNSTANTIQVFGAGKVDTNEWARIAALSTYPTTNISVTGTNNTNTLVFSNGILVEVQ